MGYIYMIRNTINDKKYIGKTEQYDVHIRWKEHIKCINREECKNRALYMAFNKYGLENFEFSVIEQTENTCEREMYWISYYDTYKKGYNETLGGDGRAYVTIDLDALREYYKDHIFKECCEHFGVSSKTMRNIMRQNGIRIISSKEVKQKAAQDVLQLTKDGEVVATYNSAHEAEITITGVNIGRISQVCRGLRKSAYGYVWAYAA